MKQKIYWIGIITLIIAIIGSLFKVNHYPGAGILMIAGFFGLIMLFFPIGLINSYRKERNRSYIVLYITVYFTFFIVFTGMLFKVMHWQFAGKLMMAGLLFPFIVTLPVFLLTTGRIEKYSIYNTVYVLLFLVFVSVFNSLLALNVSKEKLNDSMYLASVYNRTVLIGEKLNNQKEPLNEKVDESANEALEVIKEIKREIMAQTKSEPAALNNDPYSIKYSDSRSLTTDIMINGREPSLGDRLEESIDKFILSINEADNDRVTASVARDILDFRTTEGDFRSWSAQKFSGNWTCWSLVYLGILENNIILLRNEMNN